jgi:cytochrome c biogenesis protein CcmG/thiol:disulfide interchange protein DsbE
MRWKTVLGATVAVLLASAAPAVEPEGKAKPADPKSKQPAGAKPAADPSKPGAESKDAKPPSWPSTTSKKKLFARTDLRGKQAPKLEVEKWVSPAAAPKTDGKVMLIDFWATWCGPCRRLVPELEAWKKKFGEDLVIIGVSDEKEEIVRPFVDEQKITYSIAIDGKKRMKDAVGVEGIPHVLVVSSDGVVRWQGFPAAKEETLTEEVLGQIIEMDKAQRAANAAKKDAASKKGAKKEPVKKAEPAKKTEKK